MVFLSRMFFVHSNLGILRYLRSGQRWCLTKASTCILESHLLLFSFLFFTFFFYFFTKKGLSPFLLWGLTPDLRILFLKLIRRSIQVPILGLKSPFFRRRLPTISIIPNKVNYKHTFILNYTPDNYDAVNLSLKS